MDPVQMPRAEPVERLDGYELVTELASGGMATVYLARRLGAGGFQRFVAIKRLHAHLATEPEFVEMFLDEARMAAMIQHPNVVPVLEVGATSRGYYLVMEYIEGDTFARLLARAATAGEHMPSGIALRIVLDALAGLHAAHEAVDQFGTPLGLVHRDVSPQNILVGTDGIARLNDFGVARAEARLTSTRTGELKGKLAYIAPEQARCLDVDRRADLFSMGVVLWEVLAGRRLFKAESEAETLNRVLFEPIPRLRQAAPTIAVAVDELVMRALSRNPDDRPPTAARFAQELLQVSAELGPVADSTDVAAYVQEVEGNEIAAQRKTVRAWLAASEPSRTFLDDASRRNLVSSSTRATAEAAGPSGPAVVPDEFVTLDPSDLEVISDGIAHRRRALFVVLAASLAVLAAAVLWGVRSRRAPAPSTGVSAAASIAGGPSPTPLRARASAVAASAQSPRPAAEAQTSRSLRPEELPLLDNAVAHPATRRVTPSPPPAPKRPSAQATPPAGDPGDGLPQNPYR